MNPTPQTLTLRQPDDWHLHVRDGAQLAAVVPFTARQFGRALVMPNLTPPMTTTDALAAYRARILAAVPSGLRFAPQMTLYLTDSTSPDEIRKAKASGFVVGAKLYPAGATTHSDAGVTSIEKVWPALEAMAEHELVLQVHGEVTESSVDVFDREHVFIDRVLSRVVERVPRLKVVFEHITTRIAAEFVQSARAGVAATITPQHLLLNRNALFEGGIRPHHYCLPVLKREQDRETLSRRPRATTRASSLAPTARRTRSTPRKRPVAARASFRPMRPSSCMPRLSKARGTSTASRLSRPSAGLISTACPGTLVRLPCARKPGTCRTATLSGLQATGWFLSAPARRSRGA